MRILHTADWHLGKALGPHSRHEEQKAVLNEIIEIADKERVHAVLIAGDLFDTFNPPVESVELFYHSLKRLTDNGKRIVIAIAGNHDSPERIESPDPLARECGIVFVGYPQTQIHPFTLSSGLAITRSDTGFIEVTIPGTVDPLRIVLTPYANEKRMKTYLGSTNPEEQLRLTLQNKWKEVCDRYCDGNGVNIMVTHLFMTSSESDMPAEPDDEKPILDVGGAQAVFIDNLPSAIQYVALGHLHRRIAMNCNHTAVVYSGSPISYSLSEAEQNKSVTLIDIERGTLPVHRSIPLSSGKKVLRRSFTSVTDTIAWLEQNPGTLVELTIQSDTFLTAEERKAINDAHDGIVDIIPIVLNAETADAPAVNAASLSKSVEDLFRDYFKHEKGQEVNDEIMSLLREVLMEEEA